MSEEPSAALSALEKRLDHLEALLMVQSGQLHALDRFLCDLGSDAQAMRQLLKEWTDEALKIQLERLGDRDGNRAGRLLEHIQQHCKETGLGDYEKE